MLERTSGTAAEAAADSIATPHTHCFLRSFCRSLVQDGWKAEQRRNMEVTPSFLLPFRASLPLQMVSRVCVCQVGGNRPITEFLEAHGVPRTTRIEDKYKSPPCLAYRLILRAKAERTPVPEAEAAITEVHCCP